MPARTSRSSHSMYAESTVTLGGRIVFVQPNAAAHLDPAARGWSGVPRFLTILSPEENAVRRGALARCRLAHDPAFPASHRRTTRAQVTACASS